MVNYWLVEKRPVSRVGSFDAGKIGREYSWIYFSLMIAAMQGKNCDRTNGLLSR